MIQIHNLSKSFGPLVALDDVSFEVSKGQITGVLGANGAGKTTLFKILCGLLKQDSGTFQFDSNKKKKLGAIIENPAFFSYLNAKQNLYAFSKAQGLKLSQNEIDQLLKLVGLSNERNDQVSHYSLGMKQRLGIAIATLNDPDILILDEPFLGLDPLGMEELRGLIKTLAREKGLAILISSHQLNEIAKVCETLHVMRKGKIISTGKSYEILNKATGKVSIEGKGILKSQILQRLNAEIHADRATVMLDGMQVEELVDALVEEGIKIRSVHTETALEELYGQ